jgi:hypothetical protein
MSKSETHTQCQLQKGTANQVSWIPTKFAVPGQVVKLKNEDGSWDDGWVVESIAMQQSMPSKWVQERSMDFKKMRSMTDV